MTPINTYANPPTRPGRTARFSASARPVPHTPPPATPATRSESDGALWAAALVRLKITATIVALLAIVVLLVAVPSTVTVPILAVLGGGLVVGGLFAVVDRSTHAARTAPDGPDPRTRRGA